MAKSVCFELVRRKLFITPFDIFSISPSVRHPVPMGFDQMVVLASSSNCCCVFFFFPFLFLCTLSTDCNSVVVNPIFPLLSVVY